MAISQAELFKILGVETRIRIIELLKQKGTARGERALGYARRYSLCCVAAPQDPQARGPGAQ